MAVESRPDEKIRVHDKVAQADSPHDFGGILGDMQRSINSAVEEHIRKGDFVHPKEQPASTDKRAAQLADGADRKIPTLRDDGMASYGPGMDEYTANARKACAGIDKKEEEIAAKRWQSLGPDEQKTIQQEKIARDNYEMQLVYHSNPNPPKTPHLDAFTQKIKSDIEPLEKQREDKLHEVWRDLPVETKARIFRNEEESKHFKAL